MLSEQTQLDIVWRFTAMQQEFNQTQHMMQRPHVMMRPRVYPDGDHWCALYGEDIQQGVSGWGKTPSEACDDFDRRWHGETLPPTP